MRRTLTLAAAIAAVAAPALAEATEEQTNALKQAIEASDCRVTPENNAAVLEAAGLAEADAATVVQALLDSGVAVIEGGELVLVSDDCP